MSVDLRAGAMQEPVVLAPAERPTILTFDSGLGGLTVLFAAMRLLPAARHVFLADDAAFPYGALAEADLVDRVCRVIERAIATYRPHLVTIACNTASTLVLPLLRARFGIPFVGTVPAIKLAAAKSSSRAFAVLATPGTIARDYTRHLIESFASDCEVTLVASRNLAALAEAHFRGEPVDDQSVREEIAPCFAGGGRKVDTVVLACTHYPLLRTHLERLAPWPVAWIDPAPAIAQRVAALVPDHAGAATTEPHRAVFTNGAGLTSDLVAAMQRIGLAEVATDPLPPSRAPAV